MARGKEAPFHERAADGPVRAYVVALRAAVDPVLDRGATRARLAELARVAPSTVTKYLSGERIAPKGFVDALPSFVSDGSSGAIMLTEHRIEELHRLRLEAEKTGPTKSRLAAAHEEIQQLRQELDALEAAYRADVDKRVQELEAEVARSAKRIKQLMHELAAVQRDLQAEHRRRARAELEGSSVAFAMAALSIARGTRAAPRPQEVIAEDEATARQLLVKAGQLQQQAERLLADMPGYASVGGPSRFLPSLRERDAVLFRYELPVRIYTTASTLSTFVILQVNVASFVVTWRSDEGLTIGQLVAYVVLVFPVTLILGGLFAASTVFVASAHREKYGEAVFNLTVVTVLAALALGISGPFFLPPVTWVGHAWAVDIGIL